MKDGPAVKCSNYIRNTLQQGRIQAFGQGMGVGGWGVGGGVRDGHAT